MGADVFFMPMGIGPVGIGKISRGKMRTKPHCPSTPSGMAKFKCIVSIMAVLVLGLSGSVASVANAQFLQRILAIVNDDPISVYDLEQRVALVAITANIERTPENIKRLEQDVMRLLIDERLKLQEADRLNISIPGPAIDKALETLAQRNKMSLENMEPFFRDQGINLITLKEQIEAELAWNQVIRQQFTPLTSVSDTEINEAFERTMSQARKQRYQVSEVFLPIFSAAQEQETQNSAIQLVRQLRSGSSFAGIASQFSQTFSAANGGQLGWISKDELPANAAQVLETMAIGSISNPIRTPGGYYIIRLENIQAGLGPDSSKNQFHILQVFLSVPADASKEIRSARIQQAEQLRSEFRTCKRLSKQVKQFEGVTIQDHGTQVASALPPQVRDLAQQLEAGEIGPATTHKNGIELLVVCNRRDDLGNMPDRKQIKERLFNEKIGMMSRRHLRDLRRDATIEFR